MLTDTGRESSLHLQLKTTVCRSLRRAGFDAQFEHLIWTRRKPLRGTRIDIAIPSLRLAIEIWSDGKAGAWRTTRDRADRLSALGWITLNVTVNLYDAAALLEAVQQIVAYRRLEVTA